MSEISVGSVSVDVVPDARQFPRRLAAQVNPEAAKIGAEFGRLFGQSAERSMAEGVRQGLTGGNPGAQGARQGNDFGTQFSRTVKSRLEAALRSLPDVEIKANTAATQKELADIRRQLVAMRDAEIDVDADTVAATAKIEKLAQRLRDITSDGRRSVQVKADTAAAAAQLAALGQEIRQLDGRTVDIDVDVDTAGASAQLALMRGQAVGAQSGMLALVAAGLLLGPALVPIGAAGAGAMAAIASGALAAVAAIGVLALAIVPVIQAVQAVNAAEDKGAQSARSNTSAHLQMASAMDAVKTAQRGLASAQRDAAVAQQAAAKAIRDAEQGVRDAEREAALDRIESARKVSDAKRDLAETIREAARSQEDAARRVVDAERDVANAALRAAEDQERAARRIADAERDVTEAVEAAEDAQRALSDARKDAARQAEDLAARVAGGVLDERDAVLRVQEAQERLAETLADPEASDLQRQRAQLAVEEAIQGLANQRRENQRLREEKAAADAAGIEGSKQVADAQQGIVDAKQRVIDSEQAVTDAVRDQGRQQRQAQQDMAEAQRSLADAVEARAEAERAAGIQVIDARQRVTDAERDAAKSRADNARSIADAEGKVADAVAAAAERQRQSAESIASAQQAVIAAQRGVQQASQSAGLSGGAAMDTVREKMEALSPAGREFVRFLTDDFLPIFSGLSKTAQEGLLPGLQRGLEAIRPLIPGLTAFVGALAVVMGDLFEQAGLALGSPFWQDFFGYVGAVGPELLGQIGQIVGDLIVGFAGLLQAFDPVTQGFFDGLERLTQAFADFGAGASQNSGFQGFIAYIQEVGPQVLSTFGAIARAIGAIFVALAPLGPVVLAVVTGFADLISAIPAPVLAGIVIGLGLLAGAVSLLNVGIGITNALLAANPVVLIVAGIVIAIGALVAAFYVAYQRHEEFRLLVQKVWAAVSGFVKDAWEDVIRPVFQAIWGFIRNTLIPGFNKYLLPVIKAVWEGIKIAVSVAWDAVRIIFRLIVRFLREELGPVFTWLLNNVIKPVWGSIKLNIELAWGLIRIIFAAIKLFIEKVLAPVFTWLLDKVIKPVWDGIYSAVKAVWTGFLKPLFETIGGFIEKHVAPGFTKGVEAIKTAWDKVKDAAKAPVRFVIEKVINDGIIGGFNKVAGFFKIDGIDPVKLPQGFATGGYISGEGGPREDKIPAMLSNGEYVIQASVVARLGRNFLDYLNGGGSIGGDPGGIAKFARGGAVDEKARRIAETISWLPSVDPLPYIWGGVGPGGFDCSGLAGEVWARVQGLARNTRYFTTSSNFAAAGFAPGEGMYTIGVNPGTHMAGRLGGLPFEAASSASGIHVGARARNVMSFPQVYHLADMPGGKGSGGVFNWSNPLPDIAGLFRGPLRLLDQITDSPYGQMVAAMPKTLITGAKDFLGGLVPDIDINPFADGGLVGEVKKYDDGGYLPPGLTTVLNATGKPEPVFTAEQFASMRGGGGGDVTIHMPITNPVPEKPSESLSQGMRKLKLFGLPQLQANP